MREWMNLFEDTFIPEDIASRILAQCKHGVKISKNALLWRGESNESGGGMASYGLGLYFTVNKRYAQKYAGDDGRIIPISRHELPDNALRFDTRNDFQIWLQRAQRLLGFDDNLAFAAKYHDFADFIHDLDSSIDGIQMFTGGDAMFVRYPD